MDSKIMQRGALVLGFIAFFVAGWTAVLYFYAGEQAMGRFIELVSAMGYLEKGDRENALKMMQISAEGQIVTISTYGTPILDWYEPDARKRWIQRYTSIRYAHPAIEYPDDGVLRRKVDDLLASGSRPG